jgi:hypothetical protein
VHLVIDSDDNWGHTYYVSRAQRETT